METKAEAGLLCRAAANPSSMRPCQPTGTDLFEWPEFRALVTRLGLDLDKQAISFLRITMSGPEAPILLEVNFLGTDTTGQTVAPTKVWNFSDDAQGNQDPG